MDRWKMPRMRVCALLLLVSGLGSLGCSKPSEEDCRRAVLNLQRIRGLETNPQAPDPEAAVRKCRSTGDTDTVKCIIAAKTTAEADACQKKQ
jgi:hypothetical protein